MYVFYFYPAIFMAKCSNLLQTKIKISLEKDSADNNDQVPDRDLVSWLADRQVCGHRGWLSWQRHTSAAESDFCGGIRTEPKTAVELPRLLPA